MQTVWPQLEFTDPEFLWAALFLPLIYLSFRRSLVDFSRRQLITSLLVRTGVTVLLMLALAGLTVLSTTDRVFVVFAVDRSLSVEPQTGPQIAREFIQTATENVSTDRYSVMPFAGVPLADDPENDRNSGNRSESDSERAATNLQLAVQTAVASVPSGFVPHVVLLTDGNETTGNVLSVIRNDVRISTVPLPVRSDPEIQLSSVQVPAQVPEGEPFEVTVVIDTNHDDAVDIEIYSGDIRVVSETKSITTGENSFRFTQQVSQPTEFTARIRAPRNKNNQSDAGRFRDSLLDNNLASGLVFTSGKPKVLLIERHPEHARNLEWAMEEEGISIETRPARGMPTTLTDLQKYEVVMLSDIPATELTETQMDIIRKYVSELGGGFVMLGGDESFGLGGYYKTTIEDVLPVRCDFEKEKEKPGLGMVLVMDKSGSMGGQKIELAKEAARSAVDLLGEKDQIGVIAFDGSPYWISEMRPFSQKGAVMDRIASIAAGGGTTLYPAMEEAYQALRATDAKLKHIIILTDGYSTPGDFEAITQELSAARITVSTVGIGDADQDLLETIAQQGGGRYYFTDDPTAIPQIFAKETMEASKSAIKEEPFLPLQIRATPVLQDIRMDEAPFLLGYVVTRPKATSEIILTSESGDPLLAWWRYGLGMSVAFTSDAKSRWAAEWLTWPGFNRFWAQVIRHCLRKSESRGFTFEVRRRGINSRILIDALHPDGQFLNGAETQLNVVGPDLAAQSIDVCQTAPGRYEAEVTTRQPGAWQFQVTQTLDGQPVFQQSRGLIVGYPDELRIRKMNTTALQAIASATGGQYQPASAEVFRPSGPQTATRALPLWPHLLVAAMLLFCVDVALRRIDWTSFSG